MFFLAFPNGKENPADSCEQRRVFFTPEQPMREDAPQQTPSIETRNHEDRSKELQQQIKALDEQIRVLQQGPYTPRCQPGRPMEPPPAIQRHMASAPRAAQQEARQAYASPMPIRRGIRGIIDRRRARRRVSHFAPSSLQRTQFSEAQRSSLPSQRVDDVPRANNVRGSGMSSPDAYQRSEASHSSATASRGAAGADRETIAPKRVTFDGMNKSFQEQLKNNLDFVRGYFPISFLKDGKYEKLNTVEDLRNPEFQAYFPDISRIINLLVLTIQHRDFLPRQGEWLRSGTLAAVNIERQGDVTHMILRRDNLLSQPIKIDKATTPEQGIKALQEIGMSIDRQKVRGVELDLVGTDERFPMGLLASEYQILKQFNILQILPEVCSGTKVLASLARHYKDVAIDASLMRVQARASQECFYRHMIGTTSVIVITKKFFEEKKFLDRAVMKQLEEEMKKSSEKQQEKTSPAESNETTVTSAVNVGNGRDIQGGTETVKK